MLATAPECPCAMSAGGAFKPPVRTDPQGNSAPLRGIQHAAARCSYPRDYLFAGMTEAVRFCGIDHHEGRIQTTQPQGAAGTV